ncbi:MAG: beta-galactosidase small subunit, partial [Lentisphaeria bacterium]
YKKKYAAGSDVRVKFSVVHKRKTLWCKAGFEQAIDQILIKQESKSTSTVVDGDLNVKGGLVTGKNITVEFDTEKGHINSLILGGVEVINNGTENKLPRFYPYRSPVDNDYRERGGWNSAGYSQLESKCKSFKLISKNVNHVTFMSEMLISSKGQERFEITTEWNIFADGMIVADNRVSPIGGQPSLARQNFKMILPKDFVKFSWYGRGPHETYSDRREGAIVGKWAGKPSDVVNYIRPQDNSNHDDIQWLALLRNDGKGVLFSSDENFAFSALNYSATDFTGLHPIDMREAREEVYVNLAKRTQGLGNASCGPPALDQYTIKADAFSFRFIMQPLKSEKEAFELASKEVPICNSVVIERDRRGNVKLSCTTTGAKVMYAVVKGDEEVKFAPYSGSFTLLDKARVVAFANSDVFGKSAETQKEFEQISDKALWQVQVGSSQVGEGDAINMLDGNPNSFWH